MSYVVLVTLFKSAFKLCKINKLNVPVLFNVDNTHGHVGAGVQPSW